MLCLTRIFKLFKRTYKNVLSFFLLVFASIAAVLLFSWSCHTIIGFMLTTFAIVASGTAVYIRAKQQQWHCGDAEELEPNSANGDFWYDMFDLCQQADVAMPAVYIRPKAKQMASSAHHAFTSGAVVLHPGVVGMVREVRRAVVAHEIAHLKYQDGHRRLQYSIGSVLLIILGMAISTTMWPYSGPWHVLLLGLAAMFLYSIRLCLLYYSDRQSEFRADAWAASVAFTGLADLLSVLSRNSNPPRTVLFSTHPTCPQRLKAVLATPNATKYATSIALLRS